MIGMVLKNWTVSSPNDNWGSENAWSDAEHEIDYDEVVAEFFVNLIKSIFKMSEMVTDFIHPESIKQIAESGGNLLEQRVSK